MKNIFCLIGMHHWLYRNWENGSDRSGIGHRNRICNRCKLIQEATSYCPRTKEMDKWESLGYIKKNGK